MNYLKLKNGETIAYNDKGTSECVVIAIHGNMSSSKYLQDFFTYLSKKHRVISPDLRGFGKSTYLNSVNSFKEYATDIIELIETLNLNSVSLIGYDTGGAVAMEMAISLKNKVKSLVLISSVGPRGYPMKKLTNSENETEFLQSRSEIENDTFRTTMIQEAFNKQDREFLKTVWDSSLYNLNQPTSSQYENFIDDAFSQKSIADIYCSLMNFNISNSFNGVVEGNNSIANITCPTLIIHGEQDIIMPIEMAHSLKKEIGSNSILLSDNFGHSPFIDCKKWLFENVNYFLNFKNS